jgi:hypothetical protein
MIDKRSSSIILRLKELEVAAVKLAAEKKKMTVSDFQRESMNLTSLVKAYLNLKNNSKNEMSHPRN